MKIQSHHDVPRYAWLTPASSDPADPAMRITTSTGTVDLTRAEFERLADLLAKDVRARAHEEVQLHLREPRRRPRRVRLRLALAAFCAVLVVPLAACGTAGPSTGSPSSSSARCAATATSAQATAADTGPNDPQGSDGSSTRTPLDEALDEVHRRCGPGSLVSRPDRGSADAGGADDLEDDPGVPSRAEGPR